MLTPCQKQLFERPSTPWPLPLPLPVPLDPAPALKPCPRGGACAGAQLLGRPRSFFGPQVRGGADPGAGSGAGARGGLCAAQAAARLRRIRLQHPRVYFYNSTVLICTVPYSTVLACIVHGMQYTVLQYSAGSAELVYGTVIQHSCWLFVAAWGGGVSADHGLPAWRVPEHQGQWGPRG